MNANIKIISQGAGILLLRLLLDWQYEIIIHPVYHFLGFNNAASLDSKLLSWIYLIVFTPFFIILFNRTQERFLSTGIFLLFLIKFLPSTCLMAYYPMPLDFWVSHAIFWALLLILAFHLPPINLRLGLPKLQSLRKYNITLLYFITILLSAVIIYIWWKYAGARFQTSIIDVYGIRLQARGWEIPSLFNYLLPAATVILPLMLIWFLHTKNWIPACLLAVIIYLNFSIAGNKSIIFLLFITLMIYFLFREKYLKWLIFAMICVIFLGFAEFEFLKTPYISSLLFRRVMLLPNLLDYQYFDFFSIHSPDYYHQSFLRHLGFQSDYDLNIPFLIGKEYYGNPEVSANNGLLSDAYSNFGFFGVSITPLFVIFTLKFLSYAANKIEMKILMVPIVYVCFLLISTTLNTALLTGGIFMLWLFLFLLPKNLNTLTYKE